MSPRAPKPKPYPTGFPRMSGDEPPRPGGAAPLGFPRLSGDEPPIGAIVTAISAFSPHERG